MRYALLRHHNGRPYQVMNGMAGMDLDDFWMHITNEAHYAHAAVTGEVIGEVEYGEIVAFGLAENPVVLEV